MRRLVLLLLRRRELHWELGVVRGGLLLRRRLLLQGGVVLRGLHGRHPAFVGVAHPRVLAEQTMVLAEQPGVHAAPIVAAAATHPARVLEHGAGVIVGPAAAARGQPWVLPHRAGVLTEAARRLLLGVHHAVRLHAAVRVPRLLLRLLLLLLLLLLRLWWRLLLHRLDGATGFGPRPRLRLRRRPQGPRELDALEPRHAQPVAGREPTLGLHDEARLEHLHLELRHSPRVALFQGFGAAHIGELDAEEPRIAEEHLHVLRDEGAKHLLDHEQLVHLRFTGEQGLPVSELAHDAADRPDVDVLAVAGGA
mmetsp:Transcript_71286/g.206723  ORF Transcript_71286/g.206723 Transcript_71286/m.206723 type:complete len:308 (+) Transcript_71286:435-1358(+)